MKVISVVNHKGGVRKTTSVANIGAYFASKGYKTLLVDIDSQCNLT
jgi:chromosome partitioning protein